MSNNVAGDIEAAAKQLHAAVKALKVLSYGGRVWPSADVGRSVAIALTNAETSMLWLQAAHAQCAVKVCRSDGGAQ